MKPEKGRVNVRVKRFVRRFFIRLALLLLGLPVIPIAFIVDSIFTLFKPKYTLMDWLESWKYSWETA